jgi:O-antigen ligase
VFAAAGVAAGLFALAVDRRPFRDPLAVVLLAAAALGALSALWTIGTEERTLRWAAVTLGYLGVFTAAAVAARDAAGRRWLAIGVGAVALVCGAIGLAAAIAHDKPLALYLGGDWRPAGTFEYPPALALLMASAIPIFMRYRAGWPGLAVAAAVLVLAESRTGLTLGIAIAGISLIPARRVAAAAASRRRLAIAAGLAVAVAVAVAAGALAFSGGDGPSSGFLHAREDTWEAALHSFADRPLHGAGADAFLAASARHQDGSAIRFAHSLPLDFAVDFGVLGLLLALALYTATVKLAWRARAHRDVWLFAPAALAFLLSNLLDWPWHLGGAGAVWALAAGALWGCDENVATGVAQ